MEKELSQGASPRGSSEMRKAEPLPKLHKPYCMKPLSMGSIQAGWAQLEFLKARYWLLYLANPSIARAWLQDAHSCPHGGDTLDSFAVAARRGSAGSLGPLPSHPCCTHGIRLSLGSARMAPRSRSVLAASSPSCPVSLCLARYQPLPWGREGLRAREGRGDPSGKEGTGSGS